MGEIIDVNSLKKGVYKKKYSHLMYFQIWHKQVNTANFVIEGVPNVLDDCIDLHIDIERIFTHCKENNILCGGSMQHYTTGVFFATNYKKSDKTESVTCAPLTEV